MIPYKLLLGIEDDEDQDEVAEMIVGSYVDLCFRVEKNYNDNTKEELLAKWGGAEVAKNSLLNLTRKQHRVTQVERAQRGYHEEVAMEIDYDFKHK